ncbi:MAG: hypothetical protein KAW40_01035, partial [Candidatus Aenigmarchaeota archaeon]|nr:hypothetical protein [Candidatus Aenigmarchaeota archaeon]
MNGGSPRELIIEVLRKHPEGLTITVISELTKLHRHTVTKYLYELRGADIIYEREIGPARLCYIKDGITKRKEKEIMKRLNNRNMKSNIGQIQLIAVVLFLILVPAVVITAQNATNLTENVSIPLEGYITANNEGVTFNISENTLDELVSNITNKTSIEPPNVTENVTEPVNQTNVTVIPPEIRIKDVRYPEYVNLSEEFEVEVEVTSLHGVSNNVSVELETPLGFKANKKSQKIPYLLENDSVSFSWELKAGDECGDFVFNVVAKADESKDFEFFVLEVVCPPTPSLKTISYDPVTDTITIVGNGTHCTASNPCTLADIYNADQENGWNQIKQYVSYYL